MRSSASYLLYSVTMLYIAMTGITVYGTVVLVNYLDCDFFSSSPWNLLQV